jgi:serine protease Do
MINLFYTTRKSIHAMKSKLIPVVLTAALTSVFTVFLAAKYTDHNPFIEQKAGLPVNYVSYGGNELARTAPPADFENAAEASVKAVVHIKTTTKARTVVANDPLFGDDFFGGVFGQRQYYIPPQMGSGSGVVISPDGYIVTNYHVVSNTEKVTVTFNDRYTTEAEVVGKDASTDIAILKVKEKNLPYMEFGNSDNVKLGQWVLAVGYPLTLDATVTAGIVSAKSRAIGINRSQSASAVESFIQTDAAVNPGNSGGALVNTQGQLIGINSAIASPTGSYAGYSYAIPANIVKKAVNDLMKYGSVQRAYMGIEYVNRSQATPEQLAAMGGDREEGIYVKGVPETGGAYKAGIRAGDYITQINGVDVRTEPQLQEQIARYQPGDNISVTYVRSGKAITTSVELKNASGNTSIVKNEDGLLLLGARFQPLSKEDKRKYGRNGLMVVDPGNGSLARQTRIRKGFVITSVDEQPVTDQSELQAALAKSQAPQIAGFYPGNPGNYYFNLNNTDTDDSGE